MGMKIPLIAVIGGKLAAIRAFPPAQAAVRKQEFGQPDLTVASGCSLSRWAAASFSGYQGQLASPRPIRRAGIRWPKS